jgi:hypothetical protein
MNTNENDSPFGDVIYTYTRAQAVADGFQVEVTKTAQEAGIRFPVFLTRAVYDAYVTVPPDVTGQDEAGRLWDVLDAPLCHPQAPARTDRIAVCALCPQRQPRPAPGETDRHLRPAGH